MKTILFAVLFSSTLLLTRASYAESYFCQAECGKVVLVDIGGTFSYMLVPRYQSLGPASGEGATLGTAFNQLQASCRHVGGVLHDGFLVNNGLHIKLNTNVRAQKVCQTQ